MQSNPDHIKRPRIAIDGPGAVGKTTVGRMLADTLKLPLLDTGKTYRYVAALALANGTPAQDHAQLLQLASNLKIDKQIWKGVEEYLPPLPEDQLTSDEVAAMASQIATDSELRHTLVAIQRECSANGIVMVGRDVGTVVLRDTATVKIFLTASPTIRAQRITGERSGDAYEQVFAKLQERDKRDTTRTASPLLVAPNATTIDTSHITPQQVVEQIILVLNKANN